MSRSTKPEGPSGLFIFLVGGGLATVLFMSAVLAVAYRTNTLDYHGSALAVEPEPKCIFRTSSGDGKEWLKLNSPAVGWTCFGTPWDASPVCFPPGTDIKPECR
jgi:hypothetical protein